MGLKRPRCDVAVSGLGHGGIVFRLVLGVMLSAAAAVGAAGAAGAAADIAIARCATCAPPGPPVDAGARVRRDILPAVFEIVLDPAVARATVTVFLGEATMNGIMIDYRNPVAPFSVGAGGCSMTGTVMLRLNDTPNVSALYIDSVVSGSPDPAKCTATARRAVSGPTRAFRGDLVQWRTPVAIAVLRDRHLLTASVAIEVDVVQQTGGDQAILLSLFKGAQRIWSTPVTNAGAVTLTQDVAMGEIVVRNGARFTITLPSALSQGQLIAEDLTIVTGTTIVDASGVLSSWPVAPAPAPPGNRSVPPATAPSGVQ